MTNDINYVLAKNIADIHDGIIVQGVNCKGAYGAGFSGFLARKWPKVFDEYRQLFEDNEEHDEYIGTANCFCVDTEKLIFVANGHTQKTFGAIGTHADPAAIQSVLNYVLEFASDMNLDIWMPKIGAGLGGLDWVKDVEPIVETISAKAALDGIRVYVVENFV